MTPPIHQTRRLCACFVVLFALVTAVFGQKSDGDGRPTKTTRNAPELQMVPNAVVDPVIFFDSNSDCEDLDFLHMNGVGDTRFSHIISNYELRLNFANPNGVFPYTTGGGRIVIGPQDATKSVTISSSSSPATISSWRSNLPITAIIVKVGLTTYAYPYKPFRLFDTNLATGDLGNFRYVSFCFTEPSGTTAADATISGRVVDASGRGIAKAQIVLIDGSTGESKITLTNPFGYYTIAGLEVDEVYVLNVSHKRYSFEERQRTVVLTDNFTAPDFIAQPLE